jgi:hypothetical protein
MQKLSFIRPTSGGQTLVCREPYNTAELKSLLALRYQVYRKTYGNALIKSNAHRFDLDVFDARSIHVGLFDYTESHHKPIGYVRLVTEGVTPNTFLVEKLAQHYPIFTDVAQQTPPLSLPGFKYFDATEQHNLTRQFKTHYASTYETCRFCLRPDFQHTGAARFAVETLMQYSLSCCQPNSVVVIVVSKAHAAMYARYGFSTVLPASKLMGLPDYLVLMTIDSGKVKNWVQQKN